VASSRSNSGIAQLFRALRAHHSADQTDGQLLSQFLAQRDETAFATLVRRHGPMVLGVCQRILGNAADAEDAFQATFLVLVRKATSLTSRTVLGAWLHCVARRTALNARRVAARRRLKEEAMARPEAYGEHIRDDWLVLLDEELSRLPEKYRLPLVLCDLEGRTRQEAAELLGWPEGTVAGRLARARALLARRLVRRGLPSSAGLLAAVLSQNAAPACVPAPLASSTITAATLVAVGQAATGAIPAKIAALTEGVLKAMLLTRLKMVVGFLVVAAVLGGALGLLALPALTAGPREARGRAPQQPEGREQEPPQPVVKWKERHALNAERGTQIFAASISPDGKLVAFATNQGVKLLDAVTGKEVAVVANDLTFTTAISPDGKTLATGHIKAIKLWDAATGKELVTLADDTKNIAKVAFAPDSKLLATAESGGGLRLWDLATSKELRRFESGKAEDRLVYSVAFAPDGKTLASAEGPAQTVKLWDVATGKELKALEGHTERVIDVAFSPDGKTLASAGGDGQVKLWDVDTGKERASLKWQTSGRHSLAFSPDGKLLATAGGDSNNVMLWDARTGKDLVTLDHMKRVWSVAFARDGMTLVSAGDDAVRIWEPEKK
jgi:RNA polymerase sigma factor (sigma-70 family)